MTANHTDDAAADGLNRLSPLTPDPARAERVRARCRTRLERRWRHDSPAVTATGRTWRLLTPIVVGGVCVLYAVALAVTTLRFEGIL